MATFTAQIKAGLTTLLTTAEAAGVDLDLFSQLAAGAINRRLPAYTEDVPDTVLDLGVSYAWALIRRRQTVDGESAANEEVRRVLSEADALRMAEVQEAALPVGFDVDGEEIDIG